MIICICGSTKFKEETIAVAEALTLQGHVVLKSEVFMHQTDCKKLTEKDIITLTMVHAQKILMADRIFVVNVDQYIGKGTSSEIDFAANNGKDIKYYCWETMHYDFNDDPEWYLEFFDGRPDVKVVEDEDE